jgi:protein TonB
MTIRASESVVWEKLSVPRIVAVSATLSIHVVAFALLMVPVSLPDRVAMPETVTNVVFPEPPKPDVLPDPVPLRPLAPATPIQPVRTQSPLQSATPSQDLPAGDVTTDSPTAIDSQANMADSLPGDNGLPTGGEVDASTRAQYPIKYPVSAIRDMASGVVWVLVSYDAAGTVTEARIHQSSRHRELDRAALVGVRKWKINPRQVQGQPVGGQSLIEVVFNL